MSIQSTSKKVNVADGSNTAEVNAARRLQVSDENARTLIYLANEQLRQLTKIVHILSALSGVVVSDAEVDPPLN